MIEKVYVSVRCPLLLDDSTEAASVVPTMDLMTSDVGLSSPGVTGSLGADSGRDFAGDNGKYVFGRTNMPALVKI
jgi:hypothetical protein